MTYIAVDLDSTLYDFSPPFRQAFFDLARESGKKEEYFKGGYHSWSEWRSPADVCGIEGFMAALDRVHSPEVISSRIPFEGSVEAVNELADQGYDILYVTNRDPKVTRATEGWLRDCGFPIDNEELICTMSDKQNIIAHCQYLIDDRPKTLVEFVYNRDWASPARPQRKGFGMMFEYNRALTDIPNIYLAPTWGGLRYYLEEKGVLDGRRSVSVS